MSMDGLKLETANLVFTPAGGDAQTLAFVNSYSSLPTISLTPISENIIAFVANLTTSQAIISISNRPNINITVTVHVIGR